jgi:hypothetical protein
LDNLPRYELGRFHNIIPLGASEFLDSNADNAPDGFIMSYLYGAVTTVLNSGAVVAGSNVVRITTTAGDTASARRIEWRYVPIKPSTTYMLSVYARGDGVGICRLNVTSDGASPLNQTLPDSLAPTSWERKTITFTTPADATQLVNIRLYNTVLTGVIGWVEYSNLQLEEVITGQTQPTAWRPGGTGKALMVEEGTTNLASVSDITDLAQTTDSGVTLSPGAIAYAGLTGGIAFGDNTVGRYAYVLKTLNPNTSYTFSCLVKIDDGSIPAIGLGSINDFAIVIAGSSASNITVTPIVSGIYKVSGTYTTGATVPNNTNGICKYNTNSAKSFKANGFMLEAKAYATSWTDGTRVGDAIKLPANVIDPNQGTIETWVNISGSSAGPRNIIDLRGTSTDGSLIGIDINGKAFFDFDNTGTKTIFSSALALGWHCIGLKWSVNSASLYVDGVLIGNVALTSGLKIGNTATLTILSRYTMSNQFNGLIDSIRISNIPRADSDIQATYNSLAAFIVDQNTTALLDFDDTLELKQGIVPAGRFGGAYSLAM